MPRPNHLFFSKNLKKKSTQQWGNWYFGKPMFEVHEDLEVIHRDVCALVFPNKPMDQLKEFCGGFHDALTNFRNGDAMRHFHVSGISMASTFHQIYMMINTTSKPI